LKRQAKEREQKQREREQVLREDLEDVPIAVDFR